VFLSQTEKLFESKSKVCNFGRWLQFFAFDVIGELTWSKRIGFIERNEDVSGIVGFIASFLEYAGPVSGYLEYILAMKLTHIGRPNALP
jgi:hypothetical protein